MTSVCKCFHSGSCGNIGGTAEQEINSCIDCVGDLSRRALTVNGCPSQCPRSWWARVEQEDSHRLVHIIMNLDNIRHISKESTGVDVDCQECVLT